MASLFVDEDIDLAADEAQEEIEQVEPTQQIQDDAQYTAEPDTIPTRRSESPSSIPVTYQDDEIIPMYPEREVISALPLKYQQEIVEDMLTRDALLILGRGLGWELITANLLHALSSPFVQLDKVKRKRSLVFILNAQEEEVMRLSEEIADLGWLNGETEELVILAGDSLSSKRKTAYQNGGVIAISARVLVVDMLSGMVDPNDITGLFVFHAERIRETSNNAFIINLYRDKNKWGFVKAFSDEPESFSGFTPLATRMKVLRLSNVILWPRFHVTVTQSFKYHKGNEARKFVTEVNVKLSYKMNRIQSALLACIQACLGEMKRHNPTLVTEYWDMENVHDPDFVKKVRHPLDSQWHRLTYTTKQLVGDLGVLLELLDALLTVDSVTFYQMIKSIVDANVKQQSTGINRSMSPWLNLDESQTVISYAKDRALGTLEGSYVLEELPKWSHLGQLIDDAIYEKTLSQDENRKGPILIMCSSRKVAKQLRRILLTIKSEHKSTTSFQCRSYMIQKLNEYLYWKEINTLAKTINMELNKEATEQQQHQQQQQQQQQQHQMEATEITMSKTFTRNGQPISKRRRNRGGTIATRVEKLYSTGNTEDNEQEDIAIKAFVERNGRGEGEIGVADHKRVRGSAKLETELEEGKEENGGKEEAGEVEEVEEVEKDEEDDDFEIEELHAHGGPGFEYVDSDDQIIIQVYNEKYSASFLEELSPSFIIMYQPDLSFIRRVEIYQATRGVDAAQVYFMYYGDSVEEQKHLLRIKKEKEAFTRLIKEKANLGKHFETSEDNYKFRIQKNHVVNTRIAGGAHFRTERDEMRVVVDTREFGSSLPNLLYRIGIQVVPCMLTVGDYIVSPRICIERKSIPDLISSFKSGRLYTQCEQMFRYYDLPTLLIEFDENKSFSLEPFSEAKFLKARTSSSSSLDPKLRQNLQSQILSLLYSFPKLKIIWSSSPYETAQIFLELKANQEEPDVGKALDKGVNKAVVTQDGGPPIYNDDPIDFIQNIPGINNLNCYALIQKVQNIEELVNLSEKEFTDILGNENGRKAYAFLNRKLY